jgi:hypothetical protein
MYPTTANRSRNRPHIKGVTQLSIVIAYFALTAEEEGGKRNYALTCPFLSISACITTRPGSDN